MAYVEAGAAEWQARQDKAAAEDKRSEVERIASSVFAHILESVFMIYTIDPHSGALSLSGSAFVVSQTLIVTCAHTMSVKNAQGQSATSRQGHLCTKASFTGPLMPGIDVRLVAEDSAEDWAVYERVDSAIFPYVLDICSVEELPRPSGSRLLDSYFAPIRLLSSETLKNIAVWNEQVYLHQYGRDKKTATFSRGMSYGSSGGPFLNAAGKVVAFHANSIDISESVKHTLTGKRPRCHEGAAPETVVVQHNSSYSTGIVMCSIPGLMRALGLSQDAPTVVASTAPASSSHETSSPCSSAASPSASIAH